MLALYRCGRQAEALENYRRARALMSDQLALEPGPALRQLEQAILVQDACLDMSQAAANGDVAAAVVSPEENSRVEPPDLGPPSRAQPRRTRRWAAAAMLASVLALGGFAAMRGSKSRAALVNEDALVLLSPRTGSALRLVPL